MKENLKKVLFTQQVVRVIGHRPVWALPYVLMMAVFVLAPLFLVGYYSVIDDDGFTLRYLMKFFTEMDAVNTFIFSVFIGLLTTLICILLGFPAAYFMANSKYGTPRIMAMLFILPMWVNMLLRTLATVSLFDILRLPLGEGALVFGMVYNFLPFMIYPIYNTLQKVDPSILEAAQDLGAKPTRVFRDVIIPLSMPGIYSGVVMVFMPTISTFAVAEVLTMNNVKLFGTLIQQNINAGLLNYGAALSLIMLLIIGMTSFFGQDEN